MKKKRSREGIRDVPEINITPLVDLTFVLLIVFMIIAPAMEQAIGTNTPPKMTSKPIVESEKAKVINVNRNGDITLESRVIDLDSLTLRLQEIFAANPDVKFFLRADESRTYGEVISVMRAARKAGIENVALVTLPEDD